MMHYVMTLVFIILVIVAIDSCNHHKKGWIPQSHQCPTITQLQERVAGQAGEQLGDEKQKQKVWMWLEKQKAGE